MAVVDVWVPADQIEDASYVLLVNEVEEVLEDDGPSRRRISPVVRVVAGGLIAMALLWSLATRLDRVFLGLRRSVRSAPMGSVRTAPAI